MNFVRARGLEALYWLATGKISREKPKSIMMCLANMAVTTKVHEEMDFNASLDDLPKL